MSQDGPTNGAGGRRRQTNNAGSATDLRSANNGSDVSTATRVILWAVFIASLAIAVAILLVDGARIFTDVAHGQAPTTLLTSQQVAPESHISTSGYKIALFVIHASTAAIWLSAVSAMIQALTQIILCILISLISWRLLRGTLFRNMLSRLTVLGGIYLLLGGVLGQMFAMLANGVAQAQINELDLPGSWSLAGKFDLTFIGIGTVLILTGTAFRVAERLQHETEGLV